MKIRSAPFFASIPTQVSETRNELPSHTGPLIVNTSWVPPVQYGQPLPFYSSMPPPQHMLTDRFVRSTMDDRLSVGTNDVEIVCFSSAYKGFAERIDERVRGMGLKERSSEGPLLTHQFSCGGRSIHTNYIHLSVISPHSSE